MFRLFNVLKKPNRLDDFAANDNKGFTWYFTNTRGQILLLHRLGQIYVITFCLAVCWSSVSLGLPLIYDKSPWKLVYAQYLMKYICFCIVSNYILTVFHAGKSHLGAFSDGNLPTRNLDTSPNCSSNLDAISSTDSALHLCTSCDLKVPPRARHCAICQCCVLKKDHHCFFTGCCIGFYNQRYFMTFCLLGMVGGSWGIYNLGTYLSTHYGAFLSLQIVKYFLPVTFFMCLLGYTSVFEALLVMLFYLHFTSTLTSYYYFGWEMFIIYRGQTSYECMKGLKLYCDNFWMNMRSVFGPYWLIGFVLPVPILVNEGDGKSWILKQKSA
ncbi:hypothetical protein ACF0H5_022963 [Mactra antiquata]